MEAPPRYRKTFSLLTFTCIVFLSLFLSFFNKRILLLILLTQTRQFRVLFFFVVEELYLSKILYLRGKARQLNALTFNNSPITRLLALKCGSAWELVISVTLISVQPWPSLNTKASRIIRFQWLTSLSEDICFIY